MRILIISKEAWRDEQNGGNVLSNMFSQLPNSEFAQIYCNEQEPNNTICRNYYQMSDRMMVNNILHRAHVGRKVVYDKVPTKTEAKAESYKTAGGKFGGNLKRVARELVWAIGRWDKKEIITYAREFNPDIIFAPCYGNHYMQRLTALVHNALNVPVVSYISDDFYTNKQFKFSPIFWLNHMLIRRRTRKIFRHYSLVYTMTDEQKQQCEHDFGANMKILRKNGKFENQYLKSKVNDPIHFVYAGGIYLNRWKTLGALAEAMRHINADGVKMVLDIFTNNNLDQQMQQDINDGITARVHKAVSMAELMDIYHKSDVALHVEAFDITNRHVVRMSFSTKIVDCMDSGCAVMAICDKKQAGGSYLRRNECAICIHDLKQIESVLRNIVDHPNQLIKMQNKAFEVGRKYHLQENITRDLINDFESLCKK